MIGQGTHRLALEGALPLNKIYAGQRTYFEAPRQTSALAFALNTSVDLAVEYSARLRSTTSILHCGQVGR